MNNSLAIKKLSETDILRKLEKELTSLDKRQFFCRIFFPNVLTKVNLEGSISDTCYNLYEEIEKQGRSGDLEIILITYLNDK